VRSVLELDLHPHPKLLNVKWRYCPVDADPLTGRTGLLGCEMGSGPSYTEPTLTARTLSARSSRP
jgi:hypothetical protein